MGVAHFKVKKIPKEPWDPPGYKPKFCRWCGEVLIRGREVECFFCEGLFAAIKKAPKTARKILIHIEEKQQKGFSSVIRRFFRVFYPRK